MRERPATEFRPGFDRLEERRPLSGASTASVVKSKADSPASDSHAAGTPSVVAGASHLTEHRAIAAQSTTSARKALVVSRRAADARVLTSASIVKPNYGYLVYRITNTNQFNDKLVPPFTNVFVQTTQPVPGQVYNILYVAVRNGTSRTFDASSGFEVRFPGDDHTYPILTGNEQWKPGQEFVFYILSKKYYPVPSVVSSGFEFSLQGARSVGIPGPSGIYQRIKYNPATIDRILDWVVAYGPGAEGGKGIKYGLPDTAIYEFLPSQTKRIDFSGYF